MTKIYSIIILLFLYLTNSGQGKAKSRPCSHSSNVMMRSALHPYPNIQCRSYTLSTGSTLIQKMHEELTVASPSQSHFPCLSNVYTLSLFNSELSKARSQFRALSLGFLSTDMLPHISLSLTTTSTSRVINRLMSFALPFLWDDILRDSKRDHSCTHMHCHLPILGEADGRVSQRRMGFALDTYLCSSLRLGDVCIYNSRHHQKGSL